MSPEKALQHLIQIAAQVNGPNTFHDGWKQAYKVLSDAIQTTPTIKLPEKKDAPNAKEG